MYDSRIPTTLPTAPWFCSTNCLARLPISTLLEFCTKSSIITWSNSDSSRTLLPPPYSTINRDSASKLSVWGPNITGTPKPAGSRRLLTTVAKKLQNEGFLSKAPSDVIEKVREKQGVLLEKQQKIQKNLDRIKEMEVWRESIEYLEIFNIQFGFKRDTRNFYWLYNSDKAKFWHDVK